MPRSNRGFAFYVPPYVNEIRRTDPLVHVEHVSVIDLDIRANESDDLRDASCQAFRIAPVESGPQQNPISRVQKGYWQRLLVERKDPRGVLKRPQNLAIVIRMGRDRLCEAVHTRTAITRVEHASLSNLS